MLSRSGSVSVESGVGGDGGIGGVVESVVSSDTDLVENTFEATVDGATLRLAPDHPGDVFGVDVAAHGPIRVDEGSTLASTPTVERSTEFNGADDLLSTGDLRALRLSGSGVAFLSAYGSVVEREVTPDEAAVVDEDHLIAWTDGLSTSRETDGGVTSAVLGGEGVVTTFSGRGRVWLGGRTPATYRTPASPGAATDDGGPDVDVDPTELI
jgi:uncharacterized protein (TIGR00266 family)